MRFRLLIAGVLIGAAPVAAQECPTGLITYVFIDNHSIFDTTDPDLDPRFRLAYRVANSLHIRTKQRVIERELLFRAGDCMDPVLLEESERLLRRYQYLSRIDIFPVRQPDGSYHVVVDTQDEWSTQVDLRVGLSGGLQFEGVRLRETNLFGRGQELGLFYLERKVTRDYGFVYETPQLGGTRWDLRLSAGRTRAGSFQQQSVGYPFVGEVSRAAMRQSFHREDRFFDYVARDSADSELHVLLPVRDKAMELAVVGRLGKRGNLTIFGGALSFQELSYPGRIEVTGRDNFDDRTEADSLLAEPVLRQMDRLENIRVFLLLGQRNVWWAKRRGLDSMRGEQDVRLGSEVEIAVGQSIPSLEQDDDLFATVALHTGITAGGLLVFTRLRGDGRRDFDAPAGAPEWEDLLAEGEMLAYWRPRSESRHTMMLRAAGVGGWHTRTPFQLTLGGDLGVRSYDPERFPGGRRVVLSVEDRAYFGWPWPDVLDLGGTLFTDVGRVWAGDAPYGQDSGWKAAVGLGLRASFPAGGRTTYKLDLAFPLDRGGFSSPRLIMSIGEQRGLIAPFGDPQMLRSRHAGILGDLTQFRN